jgi:hypothetical protein
VTTNHLSLSREELYARVWATPITKLAAEFGVSDVALAKTCRRKQVPTSAAGLLGETGRRPESKTNAASVVR